MTMSKSMQPCIVKTPFSRFDYNKPITRADVDMDKYNAKFERVNKWLASKERDRLEYGKFLLDPTCFAYLHQKIDGIRLKYYPYQDLIANDSYRFKIFRAANQIGKSLLLDSKAARNLLWDHGRGHNEAIISKSLPLSTFQMRRIKNILRTMPEIDWKVEKGESDSLSVISVDIKEDVLNKAGNPTGEKKLKYTNYLICAPCTEGALGYDLHELNLDEFEFWKDVDLRWFFNKIAQPRTYHTKGNITIFSNPNGSDNFASEMEQQKLRNGNKKWHVYIFNYIDKPGNTQDEFDELKFELSRSEFESTVAAIRTTSDRAFFTPDEVEDSEDKKLNDMSLINKFPFFFLDVGYNIDRCCLIGGYVETKEGYDAGKSINENQRYIEFYLPIIHLYPRGYPLSRVIGSKSEKMENDGWGVEKSVKGYLDEWRIGETKMQPTFGFDATGNKGMIPLFEELHITHKDVIFSGPDKSSYYTRLKYILEKRLLHRRKHKDWDKQAKKVIANKSARGYWLINSTGINTKKGQGGNQKEPDDCIDATAGFLAIADPQNYVKETVSII